MARLTKKTEKQIYDIMARDDINISRLDYGDYFVNEDPTYSVTDSKFNSLLDFTIFTLGPGVVIYTVDMPNHPKIRHLVITDTKRHRPVAKRMLNIRDVITTRAAQNNLGK